MRKVLDEDRPFVLNAWLEGYRRSKFAGTVPNNLFDRVYSTAIQQLIDRGMQIDLLVAADDDLDQKLGFIAYETAQNGTLVVHWLYVKTEFREKGLAHFMRSSVSPSEAFLYTFRTSYSRYFKKAIHAPAIARRKNLEPVRPV